MVLNKGSPVSLNGETSTPYRKCISFNGLARLFFEIINRMKDILQKRTINIAKPDTGEEEWLATKDCFMSGWLTSGPKVKQFEQDFSSLHDVEYSIAVTNCTAALHLALTALGIGRGDEVIVPAFTWVATANAVLYCGATPVFADIEAHSFNICPDSVKTKITNRTKAIIPVHLFGLCADINSLKNIAPDIYIIEDAACAAGAHYYGKPAGSLGDIGCFSFHPRKSITTGEGGMITTDNKEVAEKLDKLRNHGASVPEEIRHRGPRPYILPDFDILGFNYRMTDIQGAVGQVQLKKLKRIIEERQKWAEYYTRELKTINWISTPRVGTSYKHGWQAYVCMVNEDKAPHSRNDIMDRLEVMGISTRPGTHAVHMLEYYRALLHHKADDFPNARDAANLSIAIPLHNAMTDEDYAYVVETLKSL